MDAAPFALVLALTLVPDETVEAGRETVEETRVLDACLSVVFTCTGLHQLTEAEAEDAAGSEEMAARIVALKVPTISSRLLISILTRHKRWKGTYVNLAE